MNKLQLYLTISNGKFQHLKDRDINGDPEVSSCISDVSAALDDIEYTPADKHIFYLLQSTDRGVFIIVLRTIPPKRGAYFGAWIFIPAEIDISDAEVNRYVQEVSAMVSNSSINNEQMEMLHTLFDRTFPTISNYGHTVANHGKYYAHRFYGGNTGDELTDLIGVKRYQTSYLRYAGVILADKAHATDITGMDITNEALDQMVRVLPPLNMTQKYSPLIFGQPFDKPYLAPLMNTVEIIWESTSAPDVSQSVMVNRPDMRIEPIAAAAQPKEIEPHKAEQGTPTEPATPVERPQPAAPQPAAPQTAAPEAKAATNPAERINVYNFEISSKSADISGMIHFALSSRTPLHDSPIDGYELSDDIQEGPTRSNHLVYVPGNSLQNNALWAVGGFIIGILLTLLCTCGSTGGKADADGADSTEIVADSIKATADTTATKTTTTTTTPTPQEQQQEDKSLAAAVKYLDTNQKWTKAELESYPDLRGLYNDLNTINRERIMGHWAKKLADSRQFSTLAEHCRMGKHKAPVFYNPKPGQKTFNVGNDETISVRSYLNCIDH